MELSISDNWLETAIISIVKKLGLVPKEEKIGKQIRIDEFRKNYCRGKGREWVRLYIFDAFPKTNFINGGWVVNPRSPEHHTTYIYEYDAAIWMEKHKHDIDWDAKVPVRS